MKPGIFTSSLISAICLLLAFCTLFLRNIIYHDLKIPPELDKEKSNTVHSEPIILAYHERPPYYVTSADQPIGGIVGSKALTVMQGSGIEFSVRRIPAKRQLNSIRNNAERICAVGWFFTKERSGFARFTAPIYQDEPLSVLTRADVVYIHEGLGLSELLGTSNFRLLVKSSYSYGPVVDKGIAETRQEVLKTSSSTLHMLDMIESGKADYTFIATEEATALLAVHPSPEAFRLVRLSGIPPGNKRTLMCSKQVSEEEIDRLNSVIAHLDSR